VLVVSRFSGAAADLPGELLDLAKDALAALADRPGFIRGWFGRAADDPGLYVLATEWAGVGAYRRALSSYQVKLQAMALLALAADEPSGYQVLIAHGPDGLVERPSDHAPERSGLEPPGAVDSAGRTPEV
jgi:hypothetical protein